MGRMKTFGKSLTIFNLENAGKWHHTIKTWKMTLKNLESNPFWESGDPAYAVNSLFKLSIPS